MKIAILAAMDKELSLLLNLVADAEETHIDSITCFKGHIHQHEVLLSKCGIGKVNAALNTYKVIRAFEPELVINSGVAGGAGGLKIGTLLVADAVAYHDVWCGPGTEYGQADGYDRFFLPSEKVIKIAAEYVKDPAPAFGLIATGDTFISKAEEVSKIRTIFPNAVAVDMESAAIAHVCTSEEVAFSILRIVSDTPGEGENVAQYKNFWSDAPQTTFNALSEILNHL